MAEPKSFVLDAGVHRYLLDHSTRLDDVRTRLIEETGRLGPVAGMQVSPEQSQFLTLLTRALGVRQAVEVGTFTGMSSLSIAMGLAPGGRLLCCDVSDEWTSVAKRYWAEAEVAVRIELRIAPATETLRALPSEPHLDLAFIDADKPNYVAYWDELVPRMRQDGVILVDNVLWRGQVADPAVTDENTVAIRSFNRHAVNDERVELVMLPISDGLTFARRR